MLFNIISSYIIWWSTAFLATGNYLSITIVLLALIIFIHFKYFVLDPGKEIKSTALTVISGMILDLILNQFNFFNLKYNYYLWLTIIWIAFSLTINHSLKKFFNGKVYWLILFAFFGGPLSYYSASKLSLIDYSTNLSHLIIHGIIWVFYIVFLKYYQRIINENI